MMIDPQIIAFAGVAAVLTLTPGADTMLVIRSVLTRGRTAGFLTLTGICCGVFIHATLSALGISLILVRSAVAFETVKLLGAFYLAFLGIQSIRHAWRKSPDTGGESAENKSPDPASKNSLDQKKSLVRSFFEGLLTNLLNPKVAFFYLAFLPQFIGPGDPVFAKSVLLASIHFAEGILWLSILTLFLGRMRKWLTRPKVQRILETTSGAVLIAFGIKLATARR
jgi:RhtB (resistance to homoserine/threonine) family protein